MQITDRVIIALSGLLLLAYGLAASVQQLDQERVLFELTDTGQGKVLLAGEFSHWGNAPLKMDHVDGLFQLVLPLDSGLHEYKFIVDGNWINDPGNPAHSVTSSGQSNSVFWKYPDGRIERRADVPSGLELDAAPLDHPVELILIWQHHQPFMADPGRDELLGPWIRLHATKDYLDMGLRLQRQPEVKACISFSGTLLFQLQRYYLSRLTPWLDHSHRRIQSGFSERWSGHTDPWIDLLLRSDLSELSDKDRELLYTGSWSCLSVAAELLARFPDYEQLIGNIRRGHIPDTNEVEELLMAFGLAWCDPIFLREAVELPTGHTLRINDLVRQDAAGLWHILSSDSSAREQFVYESGLILESILPLHRKLEQGAAAGDWTQVQVELATTPFAHPILPLLRDAQCAKTRQPLDPIPDFSWPDFARIQVEEGRKQFSEAFGHVPVGFWPGEGAIDVPTLETIPELSWTATGDELPAPQMPGSEKGVLWIDFENSPDCALLLRHTELSRSLGWRYRHYPGATAAIDLINRILAEGRKHPDRVITLILDGENAWEFYRHDHDGDEFLQVFYFMLKVEANKNRIQTFTPSGWRAETLKQYPKHTSLKPATVLENSWLPAGSWINGDLRTWIGEPEENRAWELLSLCTAEIAALSPAVRQCTSLAGSTSPSPLLSPEMSLLLAQGSDWFWWYGQDRRAFEGDQVWDQLYLGLLRHALAGTGSTLKLPETLLEQGLSSHGAHTLD